MMQFWIYFCFLFIGNIQADGIFTFSFSNMCTGPVLLGKKYNAGIIDFRVYSPVSEPFSDVCNFNIEITNTPYIGMKFLLPDLSTTNSNAPQCFKALDVVGERGEIHLHTFPYFEVNMQTYGNVNISIKFDRCEIYSNNESLFRLLVFKYGETYCSADEIQCIRSKRCVQDELACTEVYDFCENKFQNCQGETNTTGYKRYRRRGPPSIPGITLGCICLTALISLVLYWILCRKRCCRRVIQKLKCRLLPCPNSSDSGTARPFSTPHCIRETDQAPAPFTRFYEPPPSYFDLQTIHHGQIGNPHHNIPPPIYSSGNEMEQVLDDSPPPYSAQPLNTDSLQHM